MSKVKPKAPEKKKSATSEKDKQAIELQLQQDAEQLVRREVGHVLSSLTEECFNKEIFSYDDVVNFYSYPEYIEDYAKFYGGTEESRNKEVERLEEVFGKFESEENIEASEAVRAEIEKLEQLESEPQEIFEWWIVTDWLAEKLEERGEAILKADDYWLTLWGRGTSGQSISMDAVIRDITREIHKAECGGAMEKGGETACKWSVEIPFGMRIKESNNEAESFDSKTTYTVDAKTEEEAEEKAIAKFYADPAYGDENYQIETKGVHVEKMASGGAVDELEDMAWDIGIENKWISNDKWKDDASKQKALGLAKVELAKFAKGGKAGLLDGIDWIITGKS